MNIFEKNVATIEKKYTLLAEKIREIDIDTPTKEAKNVPSTYNLTIGFIDALASAFFCAIAFITKINTKIGAIPFKALTNKSPKIATAGTAVGTATAMKIPIISPKIISFNKAIS